MHLQEDFRVFRFLFSIYFQNLVCKLNLRCWNRNFANYKLSFLSPEGISRVQLMYSLYFDDAMNVVLKQESGLMIFYFEILFSEVFSADVLSVFSENFCLPTTSSKNILKSEIRDQSGYLKVEGLFLSITA